MRACLSTIQQTLTPEAASVLNHSIAEAGRRNHGHTTPLHVASVLLSSSSGLLRQACIRSHPNSSHPLQCRALELCFSVALDRLPTTTTTNSADPDSSPASDEPPISNALMAALKRAQAHQRRGCPEQQQQPLLAVKVELEQFIVSILDDPSVSRVMREASFSSPAVKSIIEHSLMTSSSHNPNSIPSPVVPKIGLGFGAMSRNLYLNPRLQSQPGLIPNPGDDVRKVIEILSRTRKKNPVLVGESEPEIVMKEVLRRIENKELGEIGPLRNVEVISVEKEPNRLRELGVLIQRRRMTMNSSVGLILDLGDLKWLVDQQPPSLGLGHQGVSEAAKEAVSEIGKIIGRYRADDGNGASLWVIGTATCETYLRCQVYHPSMEIEWDLQAVSIAAKAPLHAKFPRLAMNGILGGSVEPYSSFKSLPIIMHPMPRSETSFSQNIDPSRRLSCCPSCLENYEHEVSKLSAGKSDKPAFEVQLETTRNQLPQWLQNARAHNKDENKDQDSTLEQKSQELMKKWRERCMLLHPSFHQNGSLDRINPKPHSLTSLYTNPNLLRHQPFQPTSLGDDLRLNTSSVSIQPVDNFRTPPGSPVRTDLVLCHTKTTPESTTKKTNVDPPSKVGELQNDTPLDADSFKKLLKGLIEKVWWQRDAVSSVTTTITRCKLGNGRGRANGAKGDIWMLFSGPDRTGKKKMVFALSELVCGVDPVIICLGSRRENEDSDSNFRGKTVLDRIAEAVKRNPFSVIMLQDIDEADMFVRGSIKRALEKGRFTDSHGREISLGSIIFVLTTNNGHDLDEEKLALGVTGGWQLKLSVGNQRGRKRNLDLENEDEERASKQRKEMGLSLSFDLNETADVEEDIVEGSHNSSDVTVEYEEEKTEFRVLVDEVIIFKPVDFGLLKKNVEDTIKSRFRAILGEKMSISIGNEALDKILGGAWLGKIGLESWVEQVLTPTIHQIKTSLTILPPDEHAVARLELDDKSGTRDDGDWLPNSVGLSVSAGGG